MFLSLKFSIVLTQQKRFVSFIIKKTNLYMIDVLIYMIFSKNVTLKKLSITKIVNINNCIML